MKITNLIVGLDTGFSLDLHCIFEENAQFAKYSPNRFPGLSLKVFAPKATMLLFKSGKMICTGIKKVEDAHLAFENTLNMCGLPKKLANKLCVHNYVASGAIGHTIDMRTLYEKCKPHVFYEPEIFPGLTYRMKNYNVTVVIFATGKYILTGTKYISNLYRANEFIRCILQSTVIQ